jgi:sodium transport system permease protein
MSSSRQAYGRVARLARKELSEILRDRRTIVTLVAMPLLLYPLLSVAFQQFFLASRLSGSRGVEYRLGVSSELTAELIESRLRKGERELLRRAPPPEQEPAAKKSEGPPRFRFMLGSDDELQQALRKGSIDLILRIPDVTEPPSRERDWDYPVEAVYLASSPAALGALAQIERRFALANEVDLRRRFNLPGLERHTVVLSVMRAPLEAAGSDTLVSLPALVPLVLILMTITGAVYPAIDLTAGERERGTLEMLIAAPVPRFELLAAKYVAVVTVAVLTALVNVVSMTITLTISGLGSLVFEEGVSLGLLILLFALLLLFAAFFSAVLLCLTSFARSFKEAQAYLIPLMLGSLAPGILGMLPGLQLTLLLAVVPLLNVVLLARDLIAGHGDPFLLCVVVLIYALAALSLAARVFGSENVLYSEQSGWTDLFRRPEERRPTASVPAAMWCLAVMVPLHFALRAALPLLGTFGPAALLLGLTVGSIVLFGVLPVAFAYVGHVDWRSGFRLSQPRLLALVAGIVLGCSLWPLVLELLAWAQGALPETIRAHAATAVQSMRAAGVLTVVPFAAAAVCEEFFFRGFLFQALQRVTGSTLTVIMTSVLFGLTHAALGGALGLGQLLPSTVLGLVLGVVCLLSGSVWPGLALHVCHNVVMVLLAQAGIGGTTVDPRPEAARIIGLMSSPSGPLLAASTLWPHPDAGIPTPWLLAGLAGTFLGLLLLIVARPRPSTITA